jgi:hypothetical protein
MAQVTQVSNSADTPVAVEPARRPWTRSPLDGPGPSGPIERIMSTVIRKLAWSRLSDPRIAISVSGVGLLLGMFVGLTAQNQMTLGAKLPLTRLFSATFPGVQHYLGNEPILVGAMLYAGEVLACLGLAGMLWAHSQGWRPNPTRLFLLCTAIVAIMVSITPVGSSDTASYAAYGRVAALGGNPYVNSPSAFLTHANAGYPSVIGVLWKKQPSVYGPVATVIQEFAARIGGVNVNHTIWVLMILNGLVFVAVGFLLLKTSDDPIRATLFWTANPVLLLELVSGGHLDTFVAAAAICAVQVARRVTGLWGDVLVGVLVGVACGVKVTAALIGVGLAFPLLMRREWLRTARITAVSLVTVGVIYSFYGFTALKPLLKGSSWVELPSPWWLFQEFGMWLLRLSGTQPRTARQAYLINASNQHTMGVLISLLWPIAMIVVAWLIYQRISSDQPREVVAPFALTFAWILVAPWAFAWYTAICWVTLTQVPRNRMTRWLAIVTVVLALWHSSGGQQLQLHGPSPIG